MDTLFQLQEDSGLMMKYALGGFLFLYTVRWFTKKRRPGPRGLPFLKNLHRVILTWDTWLDGQLENIEKYGSSYIFQVPALTIVNVSSEEDVRFLLKDEFNHFPKGSTFRMYMTDLLGDGIFNIDGHAWSAQRKTASHEYSTRRLRDYMTFVFIDHLGPLSRRLDDAVSSGAVVDMQKVFSAYTLDSICDIAFGVNLGCMDKENVPFAAAFDTAQAIITARPMNLLWKIQRFLNMGSERTVRESIGVIRKFCSDLVQERREQCSPEELALKGDLLSRFMVFRDANGEPYSENYLRDVVINFILAGRDTTASSLVWALHVLFQDERVLEKLRREIDSFVAQGGQLDHDGVGSLLYLQCVVYEVLRLHTPVPTDPKEATSDLTMPSGIQVYKGEWVAYLPWAMGRQKTLWGEDAAEFRPERFLNEDGQFQQPNPFKFAVFQAGPRTCLGKNMALLEIKLVLCQLLTRYDFELAVPAEQITYAHTITLGMKNGLPMKVRRRSK